MKNIKTSCLFIIVALLTTIGLTACDEHNGLTDDETNKPSIHGSASSTLAGTYKGSLSTSNGDRFDNVTLIVSETKDGWVRVSTEVGNTTAKEIKVGWLTDQHIQGHSSQGIIVYTVDNKRINIETNKIADSDVLMSFDGQKQ